MEQQNLLTQNPIIKRALRNRQVNWRFSTVIALAVLTYCPAFMVYCPFLLSTIAFEGNINSLSYIDEVSLAVFNVTAVFLFIIVTLFAPIMAIGAIAGERQRKTLDLLLITLLPIRSIIVGKLFSALIYTLLFITFVWPIILLALVTGGLGLVELFISMIMLAVTALAFTVIGLFVSSLGRTVTNATMLMFGLVLPALFIAPPLLMLLVSIMLNFLNVSSQLEITVNFYGWSLVASLNPLVAAIYSASLYANDSSILLAPIPLGGQESYYIVSPWFIYIVIYLILSGFVLWLTKLRLQRLSE